VEASASTLIYCWPQSDVSQRFYIGLDLDVAHNLRWGIAATCTGTVKNMAGICACPAALGILEAAFGAGAPYFLSLFYQRQELGLRVAILIGMSPLGNCFASSLAYGISQIHSSVETWRLILLIGNPPLAQLPNCCDIN
jgi:MFS family permease